MVLTMPSFGRSSIDDAQAAPVAHADVERRRLVVAAARDALFAKPRARRLVGKVDVVDPGVE